MQSFLVATGKPCLHSGNVFGRPSKIVTTKLLVYPNFATSSSLLIPVIARKNVEGEISIASETLPRSLSSVKNFALSRQKPIALKLED